jgi:hypothetical protein
MSTHSLTNCSSDELVIQSHIFDENKRKIKEFSEQAINDLELSRVETSGGLFGWFDHNVTGDELNQLTSQIEEYFIHFNDMHIGIVKEFGAVYAAFEALDKDYIKDILVAVKSAQKANERARNAQKDIKKTIETQRQTISMLIAFKEQIDSYRHLQDIDDLWTRYESLEHEIEAFRSREELREERIQIMEERITLLEEIEKTEINSSLKMNQIYLLAGISVCVSFLTLAVVVLKVL